MGKKGGTSWLTAVKRAFRSPSKDTSNTRKNKDDPAPAADQDELDELEKKREKRRWIFRKPTFQETVTQQTPSSGAGAGAAADGATATAAAASAEQQRHAIAVAVAKAAAAEAAVATAQAAVQVARLTRPNSNNSNYANYAARPSREEHRAAVVIQTAFRGYLARRALRALKGLVKLQALVRGHNVRKQAKMTLRCMQALVRVQARVLDQRIRLSHDGSCSRKSAFSDTNTTSTVWESRYLQDISDRKSLSRDESSSIGIADDWDERPHTVEEVKAMLQHRKEVALKREIKNNLSQPFSHSHHHQMQRARRSPSMGDEDELEGRPKWLDRWMPAKPWETRGRASTDQRESVKTVEMDTSQPYSYLAAPNNTNNYRRTYSNQYHHHHPQYQRPSSPLHRAQHVNPPPPITPSPSKTRPIQVRSASPRCPREDRSSVSSQTPSLRSNYYYTGGRVGSHTSGTNAAATLPNYMAATESAKARIRSQSAPRQRPSTPERDRSGNARKRLSFPVPEAYGVGMGYGHNLRSPSFKSVAGSHFGLEQQSNYSSCCTESLGGEISPSSTSDLRRWLR